MPAATPTRFDSLRSLNDRGQNLPASTGRQFDEFSRDEQTGSTVLLPTRNDAEVAFLYILRCSDGSYYVGSTVDMGRRLAQHEAGEGAAYTRRRRPVELAWLGEFDRIEDAFAWEKRIQGWSHLKREAFMAGGLDAVQGWSARERRRRRSR